MNRLNTGSETTVGSSGLRTVGTNSSVASVKFTGLIAGGDEDFSSEEEDNQGTSLTGSGSSGTNTDRNRNSAKSIDVDNVVAKVKFQGLMNDDDDDEYWTDEELGSSNPFSHSNERKDNQSSQSQTVREENAKNLDVSEDYFSLPEGNIVSMSEAELKVEEKKCLLLVKQVNLRTDRGKNLIKRLVTIRMKIHELREGKEPVDKEVKIVMGHPFRENPWGHAKAYCERCNGVIIGVLQTLLRCDVCGFCCHKHCVNLITRTCVGVKLVENPSYLLDICPERGLHVQNYKCAECRAPIGFQTGMREARLCDYNGQFYCNHCHWNDVAVITSRVLSNWDFRPRKICRQSKQWLRLMIRKPVVRVQDVNPMLFSYLEELNQIKISATLDTLKTRDIIPEKLREEIVIIKKYFLECDDALKSKLLCKLQERQHFVDNSDMYSMQDLIDLANDVLLPELTKVHASLAQHVKVDCATCQSKGNPCRICNDDEILFPFDNSAFVCPNCSFVMHRHCFLSSNNKCPNCHKPQTLTF